MPPNLESAPDGMTAKRSIITVPKAPEASSPAVRAAMRGNRKRDTRPELAIRSELHRRGLRYRVDARPIAALRCKADIVFRPKRVAVFVDGCFWHGCPDHGTTPKTNAGYWHAKIGRNVERDRMNGAELVAAGWTVIRVWEHESPGDASERIARVLKGA